MVFLNLIERFGVAYFVWISLKPILLSFFWMLTTRSFMVPCLKARQWLKGKEYWCTERDLDEDGPARDCSVWIFDNEFGLVYVHFYQRAVGFHTSKACSFTVFYRVSVADMRKKIMQEKNATILLKWTHENSFQCTNISKRTPNTLFNRTMQQSIMKEVDLFMERAERYRIVGRKHHLGLLFYGEPGTGKSNTIVALASYLNWSIYTLDLTKKGFKVSDIGPGTIVAIEDFETQLQEEKLKISIAELLNYMDGFQTPDNCIFVITSNDLSCIDERFLRPGRIDHRFHFERPTLDNYKTVLAEYYDYDGAKNLSEHATLAHQCHPSTVQRLIVENSSDSDLLRVLRLETKKDQ